MAATITVALGSSASTRPSLAIQPASWPRLTWHAILLLLTLAMLFIHGYHPFSEDGGVYLAGIEYLIDPALFPHLTAFVTAHLHYSVFAYAVAALVRTTHLSLAWVLLGAYLFSLWLTLFAALRILQRCSLHPVAQFAGIALLAAWATLPVAGSSLVLIDPYLTARSFSTPLSVFAMGFALDIWLTPRTHAGPPRAFRCRIRRSLPACLVCLALAASFHPLMAGYGAAMVITLRIARYASWKKLGIALSGFAVLLAAVVNALAPTESTDLVNTAVSRYYWFLSQWQWYELCGLAGPVIVLALLLLWQRHTVPAASRALLRASLLAACTSILICLLFAHRDAPTHLVARLQPLRIFLLIYLVMTILLAASLTQRLLATRLAPVPCCLAILPVLLICAATLYSAQRITYPGSRHLELPWLAPVNPWSQAFAWARQNTPKDALFALDADYITRPREDAQTFRATARRSALPDFSKDGGEASITPSLAQLWQQGVAAQTNLSRLTDTTRDARLTPLHVTWMVLQTSAATQHPCPYRNATVKLCRLLP